MLPFNFVLVDCCSNRSDTTQKSPSTHMPCNYSSQSPVSLQSSGCTLNLAPAFSGHRAPPFAVTGAVSAFPAESMIRRIERLPPLFVRALRVVLIVKSARGVFIFPFSFNNATYLPQVSLHWNLSQIRSTLLCKRALWLLTSALPNEQSIAMLRLALLRQVAKVLDSISPFSLNSLSSPLRRWCCAFC